MEAAPRHFSEPGPCRIGTLDVITDQLISEDLDHDLRATFGEGAHDYVERLLRSEVTKYRIKQALFTNGDASAIVADAISRDLGFLPEP